MNFEIPSIKTIFIVNLLSVFFFAIIYIIIGSFGNQFNHTSKTLNLLDAIYLSMTIQSSVGFGDITPKTKVAKFFVLIQQSLTLLNISFPSLKFLQDSLKKNIKTFSKNPSVSSAAVTSAPKTSAPVTSTPVTSTPVTSTPVTSAPVTSTATALETTAPLNIISKYSSYPSSMLNNLLKKIELKKIELKK